MIVTDLANSHVSIEHHLIHASHRLRHAEASLRNFTEAKFARPHDKPWQYRDCRSDQDADWMQVHICGSGLAFSSSIWRSRECILLIISSFKANCLCNSFSRSSSIVERLMRSREASQC